MATWVLLTLFAYIMIRTSVMVCSGDSILDLEGYSISNSASAFVSDTNIADRLHGHGRGRKRGRSGPPSLNPSLLSFNKSLAAKANDAGTIILASVDSGYIDMGLNLYETSFKKFGITNYLFVCSDEGAMRTLEAHNISCYLGKQDSGSSDGSIYGSPAFRRKTHLKTYMTLDALSLGYSVLVVDVDIVFLKNPFPFFHCADCDIHYQSDGDELNSGFYFARPTRASIKLHEHAIKKSKLTALLSNQKTLARTLEDMVRERKIKAKELGSKEFPRGEIYYEKGKRMFYTDNPCLDCVIVHNNWIVGGPAKKYRFKEFLMWELDTNGYYSNPNTKYLTYDNPAKGSHTGIELDSLRYALYVGYILNRTLILPTFTCKDCRYNACKTKSGKCSLNTHVGVKDFEKCLGDKYREHVFLDHPKVPDSVKKSTSKLYMIKSGLAAQFRHDSSFQAQQPDVVLKPASFIGPSRHELKLWFDNNTDSVLRFHSFYGLYESIPSLDEFKHVLSEAVSPCDYRQYCDM